MPVNAWRKLSRAMNVRNSAVSGNPSLSLSADAECASFGRRVGLWAVLGSWPVLDVRSSLSVPCNVPLRDKHGDKQEPTNASGSHTSESKANLFLLRKANIGSHYR